MKNFIKNYWAVFIPIIVLVIALIYLFQNKSSESNKEKVIGMVDAEFVDVSASLPGRVVELLVKEGDEVKEGQVVAQMKTSEIETIQSQMSEAVIVAQNQLDKINRGVEPEVLKSAENLQQIAKQQMDLMNKTYTRFQNLYSEGVISGQERDVIYFKSLLTDKKI